MNYTFVGKSDVVSDSIKDYAIKRLDKLDKFLPDDTNVKVTFRVVKFEQKVEITINLNKRTLRSEVSDKDMYAAIDKAADSLEKQLSRYKDRVTTKSKKDSRYKEELNYYFSEEETYLEDEPKIIRSKKFAMKPMDAEEAVIEMDLIGHSFYVFRNSSTDEVNVVYKRSDNDYGLIEPEH